LVALPEGGDGFAGRGLGSFRHGRDLAVPLNAYPQPAPTRARSCGNKFIRLR
jgi:hypothetical protein